MVALDLKSKWLCYCILGKVGNKRESLHYLENWIKLFYLIDDFLKDCPSKSLISEQTKEVILKLDKSGIPRTTSKNVPTGGVLQWNEKNNRKICQLYLQEQYKEILAVEKDGVDYYDWLIEQFPTRNSWIKFDRNYIHGYLSEDINIKKTANVFPDFLFQLSPTFNPNKVANANTEIQIYISDRYFMKKGVLVIDKFAKDIGEIANAVIIGKALTPYQKNYINKPGTNSVRGYVSYNYADREKLLFSKIGIDDWETLYDLRK